MKAKAKKIVKPKTKEAGDVVQDEQAEEGDKEPNHDPVTGLQEDRDYEWTDSTKEQTEILTAPE